MKIVFMGTPDFAVGALESIIKAGHEVTCVVTQPDKPKGRSDKLVPCPVKECALAHGLNVFQPEKIRKPESQTITSLTGIWIPSSPVSGLLMMKETSWEAITCRPMPVSLSQTARK